MKQQGEAQGTTHAVANSERVNRERGVAAVEHLGILLIAGVLVVVILGSVTSLGSGVTSALCQRLEELSDGSTSCTGSGESVDLSDAVIRPGGPGESPPVCRIESITQREASEVDAGLGLWRFVRVGATAEDYAAYTVDSFSDGSFQVHLAEGIEGGLNVGVDGSLGKKGGKNKLGGNIELARNAGADAVHTFILEDEDALDAFMPGFEEQFAEAEERGFLGRAWEGAKGAGRAAADWACFWCDDSDDDKWSHLTQAPDSTTLGGSLDADLSGGVAVNHSLGRLPINLNLGGVERNGSISGNVSVQQHHDGEKEGLTTLTLTSTSGSGWEASLVGLAGGGSREQSGAVHVTFDSGTGELAEIRTQSVSESGGHFAGDLSNLIGGIDLLGQQGTVGPDGFTSGGASNALGLDARREGTINSSSLVTDVTLEVTDANRDLAVEWLTGFTENPGFFGMPRDLRAGADEAGGEAGPSIFWPNEASDDPVQQMLFDEAEAQASVYATSAETTSFGGSVDLFLASGSYLETSMSSRGELVQKVYLGGRDTVNPGLREELRADDCF